MDTKVPLSSRSKYFQIPIRFFKQYFLLFKVSKVFEVDKVIN